MDESLSQKPQFIEQASAQLDSLGYTESVPLLSSARCQLLAHQVNEGLQPAPDTWWKGYAVADRDTYDVATHPAIRALLHARLGPDVLLWGAQYVRRTPRQQHAWHSDIETEGKPSRFVSVWIGIENATTASGLRFVSRSYHMDRSVQQVTVERGLTRSELSDETVLQLVKERVPTSAVAQPAVGNGEGIFFTGGLWHTSLNTTDKTRTALLLQYCTPEAPVLVPDFRRLDWPFGMTDVRAPCLLISGTADLDLHDIRPAPLPASIP